MKRLILLIATCIALVTAGTAQAATPPPSTINQLFAAAFNVPGPWNYESNSKVWHTDCVDSAEGWRCPAQIRYREMLRPPRGAFTECDYTIIAWRTGYRYSDYSGCLAVYSALPNGDYIPG